MAPNRRSRYSGKPRAVKFERHMLPRLRSDSGACNIQVPALRESEVINLAFVERLEAHADDLVLFWEELFDIAKGLGFDILRGAPC